MLSQSLLPPGFRSDCFVDGLLFGVLTSEHELAPAERLYIVTTSHRVAELNQAWLSDLYLSCGWFDAARKIYELRGDWRKLGDILVAQGNLDGALEMYRRPSQRGEAVVPRQGPDNDRIMAVAFRRRNWNEFIEAYRAAAPMPLDGGQVILCGFSCATSPLARRLAIAAARTGIGGRPSTVQLVRHTLDLDEPAWGQMIAWAQTLDGAALAREDSKLLRNLVGKAAPPSKIAITAGQTERARKISDWIMDATAGLTNARRDLLLWLERGDREALVRAGAWVTGSGVLALTRSAFFELSGRRQLLSGPLPRIAEFYRAHPHLMRIGLGQYLSIALLGMAPLGGEELLAAVYQALGWPERSVKAHGRDEITTERLKSCEEWAEIRLEEWATSPEGESCLAKLTKRGRVSSDEEADDIRRHGAWVSAMENAIAWLSRHWRTEIGGSRWQSENQAFELLRRAFKGQRIFQHDQPSWVAPQHLDVHLPDLRLAVEYMGIQHYEPVEVFGGREAYDRTVERDKRKAESCRGAGVTLEYIRYDDDLATRVAEIAARFGQGPPRKRGARGR